jgi:hypothetical protein
LFRQTAADDIDGGMTELPVEDERTCSVGSLDSFNSETCCKQVKFFDRQKS